MLNRKYGVSAIVFCLLFFSCKKENDKDWLVIDLHVTDQLNGSPIPSCAVYLCYDQYTLLGSYAQYPVDLGITDANGYLHVSWKRPAQSKNFRISLYPPGKYATPFLTASATCDAPSGIPVSPGKLNVIEKLLTPYAWFRMHYVNQTCFDQNDSLVLNATLSGGADDPDYFTKTLIGCADTIIPYSAASNTAFIWTQHPTLNLEKKIYKNGWDTTLYETIPLNADGQIQVIDVFY